MTYRSPWRLEKLQEKLAGVDGAGTCDTEEGEYGTDFFHASDMRQFLQSWGSAAGEERGTRSMMIGRDFGVQTDRIFEKELLEGGLLYLYCVPGFEPPKVGFTVIRLKEGCVATNYPPQTT
ncbi:hypothetical protein ACWKT5_24380 [Streptomyces avermitilis]